MTTLEGASPLVALAARWVSPSTGLPKLWLTTLLVLAFGVRSTAVVGGFLEATFVVGCTCMLAIAGVMPPPVRISETSALAARFAGFLKITWAAFIFTAGAVYGGVVSSSLAASTEWQSSPNALDYLQQFIWPLVGFVATVAGVYGVLACALDLHRAGDVARAKAITQLLRPLELQGRMQEINRWLQEFLRYWVSGWRPLVLALSAPVAAPILWAWIALVA